MSMKDIQTRLQAAGLYSGTIDGKWGAGTEAGVTTALDRAGIGKVLTPIVAAPSVLHPQYTIESFIKHFIETYEGGLSLDPKDSGNFYRGVLVGSKYGVTGAALAEYRGVSQISAADIAALTEDEAIKVGVKLYFDDPDFDLLPWNPWTASVMDMGWGAGPGQAIKLVQRQIGANDDGKIGRYTVQAFEDYIVNHGLEAAARTWCDIRYAFYDQIIKVRPTNAKYRNGWRNRSAGFLPGTPFWQAWNLPPSNR